MHNAYHATIKYLMTPILPEGFSGFSTAHFGQCSQCANRVATELPYGDGGRGEVNLCTVKRKAIGPLGESCATRRRCRSFSLSMTPRPVP